MEQIFNNSPIILLFVFFFGLLLNLTNDSNLGKLGMKLILFCFVLGWILLFTFCILSIFNLI